MNAKQIRAYAEECRGNNTEMAPCIIAEAVWEVAAQLAEHNDCQNRYVAALIETRADRSQPDAETEHAYTSTACFHGQHDRCRQQCKFCGAKCACSHHTAAPASEPAQARERCATHCCVHCGEYIADLEPSHLVRGKQTLCGLSKWSAGNVDIDFGIRRGITTCVHCLRVRALEIMQALAELLPIPVTAVDANPDESRK
jgi:hypothetical protein